MPLITPRRRFLVMAPLALLLPAGLLTYLGLELVNLIDKRYEERAEQIVQQIRVSIRNSSREALNTYLLSPFRETMMHDMVTWNGSDRIITHHSPYVKSIFIFKENTLHFFYPKNTTNGDQTTWVKQSPENPSFENRLISSLQIDVEITESLSRYNPDLYGFFNATYPDVYPDPYDPQQTPAQMAFYAFPELSGWEFPSLVSPDIHAIGFTVNVEQLTKDLFQGVLDRMWQYQADLPYPVAVVTKFGQEPIAQPEISGATFVSSTRFQPDTFDARLFPWLQIQYSNQTGANFFQGATNEKLFYYLLILTANICMIAAVVGALRDIANELRLSDMRSNFVARVSHELRTPLGLIRLFAETLEMDRVDKPGKRQEYLHAITKESERLTNLINNILNFSQIEANTMHYSMTPQYIQDIIEESLDTMHYHFQRHDFELDVSIEPDLPRINMDPEAIQQVLFNLFSNAVKYGAKGQWLGVNVWREGQSLMLTVADRGFGIASDHLDKIFHEFYRVDDPQVRETGGSGLGLAVVRHIIHAHQGKIQVESTPGEGTTFTVTLPIQAGSTEREALA